MRGLLVRVGADQTKIGGGWNAPCDSKTGQFVYVPIIEDYPVRPGLELPYDQIESALGSMCVQMPIRLKGKLMHLDPDFSHLTYGDQGQRAKQIQDKLKSGDLIAFYSALRDRQASQRLVYALIGLYVIRAMGSATLIAKTRWHTNAHSRRLLAEQASDVVVEAEPNLSGRLDRFVEIGEYRGNAYRVKSSLLHEWGGLSVKDGYLQRSARLPEFNSAQRFYDWFQEQQISLIPRNN